MLLIKKLWTTLFMVIGCLSVQAQESVSLSFSLEECATDSMYLYTFQGMGFEKVAATAVSDAGKGSFTLEQGRPAFYYLGTSPGNNLPLILGSEPEVVVTGNCLSMREAEVMVSELNLGYLNLRSTINEFNKRTGTLFTQLQRAQNEADRQELIAQVQGLDQEKKVMLETMQKEYPYLGKILALNTYLSYFSSEGGYDNELEYFANEFFAFVDFSDPELNNMPWVYQNVQRYAQTILSVPIPDEQKTALFDQLIERMPENSNTSKLALAGIIAAAEQKQSPVFVPYAKIYVERFGQQHPQQAAALAQKIRQASRLAIGSEAPDFTQETPGGEELALSDLRGNYVLIDFWASWCGPCRRENPNVVRLYHQYKDAGFTILGVSLDQNRERWLQAIEADELTWHHVSDLKGWQNEVAADYEIRSIPRTILVDPQGVIIAKDLRGGSLENKLKEIFGDQ